MRCPLSRAETMLLAAGAALFLLAWFGPAVGQPAGYHHFADQRELWGLPMAMDVLSNIPFALAGLAGALALWRVPAGRLNNVQRAMSALFFSGLLFTAAGSAWYHLAPDDAGQMFDRCGMAIAFAGLLGLAAADCISERAGAGLGLALLLLGPLAARVALQTGNALPWAAVQFGGIAVVLALTPLPRRNAALSIHWGAIVLLYGAAKVLEMNDHALYQLTGHWISGHTLKHVVAAMAAVPVIFALGKPVDPRQNAAHPERTRKLPAHRPVLIRAAQEETR
jgi:hypothetical protein